MDTPQQIIVRVAQEEGVDPALALAVAQQESGFNPSAVGDGGHSVGLFQLHDQGMGYGMGNARYDPETNARVAIHSLKQTSAAHPGVDPGTLAALSQRPADPVGYARSVNAILGGTPNQTLLTAYRDAQGLTGPPNQNTPGGYDRPQSLGIGTPPAEQDPELTQLLAEYEQLIASMQGSPAMATPTTDPQTQQLIDTAKQVLAAIAQRATGQQPTAPAGQAGAAAGAAAPFQGPDGIWHYPQPDGSEELSQEGPPSTGTGQPDLGGNVPAEVVQAYFNAILQLVQQSTATMAQQGTAPEMTWDANAYGEGRGGFVATGSTLPTLAAVNQAFTHNQTQLANIANLAAQAGRVPIIRATPEGGLELGVDAAGNPLYDESLASRGQRLTAAQAIGYIPADLLKPPPNMQSAAAKYIRPQMNVGSMSITPTGAVAAPVTIPAAPTVGSRQEAQDLGDGTAQNWVVYDDGRREKIGEPYQITPPAEAPAAPPEPAPPAELPPPVEAPTVMPPSTDPSVQVAEDQQPQ